jgi:hypothetical protein
MANYLDIAAQLRQKRSEDQAARQQMMSQAPQGGGVVGQGGMFSQQPVQQTEQQNSLGSSLLDGLKAYNNVKGARSGAGGAFTGASPAAMGAMGAGGGSSLGSMGLMGGSSAAFPGAATGGTGGAMAGAGPAGWLGLGAKALNDSGISSYGNTMKGQWAGNLTDKVIGDRDNTGAARDMVGSIGNFFGGDFGGGFDRAKSGIKDLFRLKLW